MMRKASKGRKKIEMAKIENQNRLQVTFSKRRAGVFKKASELSTLCGAEVGLLVFSPANKVYSFGHPDFESIVDRYHSRNVQTPNETDQFMKERREATAQGLNLQLTYVENQLEIEKKRGKELDKVIKDDETKFGWGELNLEELEKLKTSMEELKTNVEKCVEETTHHQAAAQIQSSTNSWAFHHFVGAGPTASDQVAAAPLDPNYAYAVGNSMMPSLHWI